MSKQIGRRPLITGIVLAGVACLGAVRNHAATKTYKYRCPKCNLIQEYGTMGAKKCPNDGMTMIPMN